MIANDLWEFVTNGFNGVTIPIVYASLKNPKKTQSDLDKEETERQLREKEKIK